MRIAILARQNIYAESLSALLRSLGHFDVVGHTDDVLRCLNLVRDENATVVVAQAETLNHDTCAYLGGAQSVQSFSIVVILEEGDDPANGSLDAVYLSPEVTGHTMMSEIRGLRPESDRKRRPRLRKESILGLTAREREVVDLVAKGLSNKQIAELIGLQDQSVKNMVSTVMRRLKCENRTQLALKLTQAKASRAELI